MTPITKQQVEELIDHLASKELTEGVICKDALQKRMLYLNTNEKGLHAFCVNDSTGGYIYRQIKWDRDSSDFQILGHPILIGDVLEKYGKKLESERTDEYEMYCQCDCDDKGISHDLPVVLDKWQPCGFTKSLQSIFEEVEWEKECQCCLEEVKAGSEACEFASIEVPRQPAIRDLFQFLLQLGL